MGIQRFYPAYDDQQGIVATALVGVTTWVMRQVRSTGVTLPHITTGDVFSFVSQFSYRKKLDSPLNDVHMHFIPIGSKDGNIAFTYTWGWFNIGDTIPDTLPNAGTVPDIALLTTDQYKFKLQELIENLTPPANEEYSSFIFVKFTAVAPAGGTNWWTGGNEIAIAYLDAHYFTDRLGSINEFTD